ncbi:MAG: GGDEF domain-containing protein [Pseudomonadaceae bacterium]
MTERLERNVQHRRHVLRALLWITVVAGIVFALININRGVHLLAALELIYATFAASLLRIVGSTPHLMRWTIAFLLPFFCIMEVALLLPQSSFTVFAWIQTIPIISYLLLGKRGGFWMSLVFISLGVVAFNVRYLSDDDLLNMVVAANVGFSSLAVMLFSHIYERSRDDNEQRLIELAGTDSLTGLANRMRLGDTFRNLRGLADRGNTALSLVVLDLDHFKQVNDRYGHEVGDSVLQRTAEALRSRLRDSDLACRLGGEEFALLLPGATLEQAADLADALRIRLEQTPINTGRDVIFVTFSAGVASLGEDGSSLSELLRTADRRMYEAKGGGRNQVVAAGQQYALSKQKSVLDGCSE